MISVLTVSFTLKIVESVWTGMEVLLQVSETTWERYCKIHGTVFSKSSKNAHPARLRLSLTMLGQMESKKGDISTHPFTISSIEEKDV